MRKWLFLLMVPVLFQETHLLAVRTFDSWEQITDGKGSERDVRWCARSWRGGGGGGSSLIIEDSNGRLIWESAHNLFGPSWVYRSDEAGGTRFLVYQPVLGGAFSPAYRETPEKFRSGIWILVPTSGGYQKQAVLTNPLSLVVRNPGGLGYSAACLAGAFFGW